jgi:hypothetical protein
MNHMAGLCHLRREVRDSWLRPIEDLARRPAEVREVDMPESDDVVGETPRVDPEQLAADKEVRDVLAAINFDQDHPLYRRFIEKLAHDALARMHGMMASGKIFAAIQKRRPCTKRSLDDPLDKVEDTVVAPDDPLESMITMRDFELLLKAAGLNEKQCTAIKMLLERYSQAEIAEALDLSSAKAVENLLGRARKELKRQLGGGEHGTQHA